MKRKKTKTTWIQSAGDDRMLPIPSRMKPIVPNHVPPRNSQTIEMIAMKKTATLNQYRQNQARRRADDVLLAKLPALDAEEARRRDHAAEEQSAKPRKTMTTPSVASSAFHQSQSFCWVNQTNSAGAVTTATTVAARVRRRQLFASSWEASACGRPGERRFRRRHRFQCTQAVSGQLLADC